MSDLLHNVKRFTNKELLDKGVIKSTNQTKNCYLYELLLRLLNGQENIISEIEGIQLSKEDLESIINEIEAGIDDLIERVDTLESKTESQDDVIVKLEAVIKTLSDKVDKVSDCCKDKKSSTDAYVEKEIKKPSVTPYSTRNKCSTLERYCGCKSKSNSVILPYHNGAGVPLW